MNVRYFIGFRVSSELRFAKERLLDDGFKETTYEESPYLGIYTEKNKPTVREIEAGFLQLEEKLSRYRLEIPKRLTPLLLIPELMIG
jgi:hypothetical protein